ncbi:hypothetical protein [Nonomuraea sp. NPDC049695]|uniref:hypothetical protein n=1 Tax=Nonomuraea sp. NPDC049695 TaxID=3154734 RepID=UPI003413D750
MSRAQKTSGRASGEVLRASRRTDSQVKRGKVMAVLEELKAGGERRPPWKPRVRGLPHEHPRPTGPRLPAYFFECSAKSGLMGVVRALSREWASQGIRAAQRRLNTLKGEWMGHCEWGPEDGLPGYNDCSAYVEGILNDPKGPLHDPDGYAHQNADKCRREFVGKALDACLSVVMSPLFSFAKTGIADRETGTHRLAEEYLAMTGLDLINAASRYSLISDCK